MSESTMPLYFCCDERRRDAVRGSTLNGIDYLEVVDQDAPNDADRQRFVRVHFVNDIAANSLAATNLKITGGERIRPIVILDASIGTGDDANLLTVEVEEPGDFSIYTLSFVRGPQDSNPPDGIDPRLSAIDFSFKVECPSDFDCAPKHICPPEPRMQPEINYLAKDYASFRKLILDRMALLVPAWRERNPADLGITLVELLAYVGDHLSYQQDAIATEAYLNSARKRVSLQRHARLVDYFVHNGTNSRVWVQLTSESDLVNVPAKTQILSRLERTDPRIPPASSALDDALRQHPVVFETAHDAVLFAAHNGMPFYTWSDRECCLPQGATFATLAGHFPDLAHDAVLIFEEQRGPLTGEEEDADRTRRWAVRLTSVQTFNAASEPLTDPLTGTQISNIEWMTEDALRFPFCLSGFTDEEHGAQFRDDLSIAHGNIVLADHGLTIPQESLGEVPAPQILLPPELGAERCHRPPPRFARVRFRPTLQLRPLTQASRYEATLPASASLVIDQENALPAISLQSTLGADTATWHPQRDLLGSASDATEFVVEIEHDGLASLRFGDDEYGQLPESGTTFEATYRIGNGSAGNVGAETLAHIVSSDSGITGVRNPMPAAGGIDPKTMVQIRRDAPEAFRTQKRAVTEADYARTAERNRSVQRAAATFRWTGSWHTVFVTVDRFDGLPLTNEFETQLRAEIEPYRMAGHDLEIDTPEYVPLEIEMFVCVKPEYFRSDVDAALLDIFSSRTLADGSKGLFQPDFFTFGQTVYLSPLYAAAQAVAGVASVEITVFQRQDLPATSGLTSGFLTMDRLEIVRLENDPNFAERGIFSLKLGGGR
ncbi:MAG TPA: putative baseplate assembly protein [Chthoniobacterales bacterium]|nr:putative baseplate assembly protein [Chthoniobacterales bacterium]